MHHRIKYFLNEFISEFPVLFFISIIIVLVFTGTILFSCIEHRTIFNSFYFTSITMSTIGYGDIFPLTHAGKVIAIIYGFMGAPLFVGLTGLFFQNKFQVLVKHSIHAYHKEAREAELLALQNQKTIKKEEAEIKKIEKEEEEKERK
ncbi:MAG: potassium channel family protein [candidate division SR1 bacterium]|nr:potassium channel family protein [candidate division SR1 bacterium]